MGVKVVRRVLGVFLAMFFLLAACATDATSPIDSGSLPPATPAPSAEVSTAQSEPDWVNPYRVVTLVGDLVRGEDCWVVDLDGRSRAIVFPAGTTVVDGVINPGGAGETVSDRTAVDIVGSVVHVDTFRADISDSLASLISTCSADLPEVVVVNRIEPAYDPSLLSVEDQVALVRAADLSDSYPCGLGFSVSTADQRVSLLFYPIQETSDESGVITFPSAMWDAKVVVGRDLMANWCNDAIESFLPAANSVSEWEVASGTLSYTPPDTLCGSQGPVKATLVGIEVSSPLGPIQLGDMTITNDQYGCFAG